MIADDSVVVRGLVARWLEESGFEVVATVPNGRLAIEALDRVEPDLVLLDLDMPELDGISALPKLLEKRPNLSIIVVSTLTQRNADISLKCLRLGAVDYLPKPESNRHVTISASFRAELIAKLKGLAAARQRAALRASGAIRPDADREARSRLAPRSRHLPPRFVLIGASTGGPQAITQVLGGLGASLGHVPVLVVQHMPAFFTKAFAEHLSAQTGLAAREPEQGEKLAPGRIYVAPGGRHMGLERKGGQPVIRLDDGPPLNFCRPAVDVLFGDAAHVLGSSVLALVLTGMGSDGTEGARTLIEAGATVLAQDEATSIVWGMPGSVARAGLAQTILPLPEIAPTIRTYLSGSSK